MTHTDEERDALQELDAAIRCADRDPEAEIAEIKIGTIRTLRRMATRPAMPEEWSRAQLDSLQTRLRADFQCSHSELRAVSHAFAAELTRPKTKTETFKRWLVVTPKAEMGPYLFEAEARGIACGRPGSVIIELTGSGEVAEKR